MPGERHLERVRTRRLARPRRARPRPTRSRPRSCRCRCRPHGRGTRARPAAERPPAISTATSSSPCAAASGASSASIAVRQLLLCTPPTSFQNKRSGGKPTSRRNAICLSVLADSTTGPGPVKARGPVAPFCVREGPVCAAVDECLDSRRRLARSARVLPLPRRAVLDLDDAVGDAALAHDDLVRPADEVGVGELDAGALVTVVEDDLDAASARSAHRGAPRRSTTSLVGGQRDHGDLERRHRHRPRDARARRRAARSTAASERETPTP